ncbi:DUF6136 family protein [Paraburkholderia sp. Ac-20347]|uniref:DUF6136 family protein n=1 Tax=Paraburkholderia sp. Ac-20347 TaxID=2703892 RepID=UPI0019808B4B|nr:DUF6136 family protein [Paraburkholderia sp. Ac-20347]MBN3812481.1 hypothetical protein [Paraburkholderia sp. Ac-20347]
MLLSLRLRWYAFSTSRLLRRHWQTLTLAALLLIPAMPVFAQARLLGAPVLETLSPAHGVEWRYLWLHLLEAAGVLWVAMQRSAIGGGPFAPFLASLPVRRQQRRFIDAVVVLIASTPLLLPVLAAAIALAFLPQKIANYLFVADLLLITLGWQLAVLARERRNVIPLALANAVLVGALEAEGAWRVLLLMMPLLLAVFALVDSTPSRSREARARAFRIRPVRMRRVVSPLARLQFGIVRERAAATFARCLSMGAVVAANAFLIGLWDFDARTVPLTLIADALIALIAAATYRDLRAAHHRASPFMRSLPIAPATQVFADYLTVLTLAFPFAAIAPLWLAAHGVLSLAATAALMGALAPLLAVLALPQRYVPRQSALTGILLAVIWVAAAWHFFV